MGGYFASKFASEFFSWSEHGQSLLGLELTVTGDMETENPVSELPRGSKQDIRFLRTKKRVGLFRTSGFLVPIYD